MKKILFWPYQLYVWLILMPLVFIFTLMFGSLTAIFATLINPHFASRVFGVTWARWLAYLTPIWVTVEGEQNSDRKRSYVVVSNHQSMYDISPIMWFMRKHHVRFVSEKELGHGIPSVSYNLRHGGSVLIDRRNQRQAISAILKFSEYIESSNRAAVIFPEGTRSKDGRPKPFQTKGLLTMMKKIPSALIVPITVNNSWKMLRYGKFPMGIGNHIKFKVHTPIKLANFTNYEELIEEVERIIIADIEH